VLWEEIEAYLLVHSSELKKPENHDLISRIVISFDLLGRTNEAFWKIFSQLYEEIQPGLSFNSRAQLMDCFANHVPAMSS
jgi:hypothetical protein